MAKTPGFGVDIGGSAIKGCTVDLRRGSLDDERVRIVTPQPATPEAVAKVVAAITRDFGWHGPMGVTLPCVVKDGVALTAANVDRSWIGTDAAALFSEHCRAPVTVFNDADAAGLAEMRFGAGRDRDGVILLLTFGTGIGSALFLDGELVPNTELGHLQVDGADAEDRAAASARDVEALSWTDWAPRVSRYLQVLENLLWPDLIIVGGGISKKADRWLPLLECRTRVVAAALRNDAGIVGAALAAYRPSE
ncbi:MAG: polyphosphate--glucose phosphotransferase [Pseudonocardiaceae bacterium]